MVVVTGRGVVEGMTSGHGETTMQSGAPEEEVVVVVEEAGRAMPPLPHP